MYTEQDLRVCMWLCTMYMYNIIDTVPGSVLKARYQLESAAKIGKFQRLMLPLNGRIEDPL